MIIDAGGDMFVSGAEALVNTVNTRGAAGKGLALAFRNAFPANFVAYEAAARRGELRVGFVFVSEPVGGSTRWVVNFPTKDHWRNPSKIEWIVDGLNDLRRFIVENEVGSIAVPALGCGLGGLDWGEVRPLIVAKLGDLAHVRVMVYPPG